MSRKADLVRIEIPGGWEDGRPSTFSGRALNSWLFGAFARADARAAEALHEIDGVKPFSIALAGPDEARMVVTGYGPCVEPVLQVAERLPDRILLNARWWRPSGTAVVTRACCSDLATPLLEAAQSAKVRFQFLSPTTFHSRGRQLPLPVPELVFGSLLQRWARWLPVDLGDGAAATIEQAAVLVRFRAASEPLQLAGHIPGFTGSADFALRRPPPEYAGLLAVLARFANFAGVGQKVTTGMGCVLATPLGGRSTPPPTVAPGPS